jgi:hypothetical protein
VDGATSTEDTKASSLERVLMRDRAFVIVALNIVIRASWF